MQYGSEFNQIEKDLKNFMRPARYIGQEIGTPNKDFAGANLRFAICYPDVYEIGMSNLGIKILYDKINALDFASCERVFAPWTDFEAYLREHDFSLFSLETKTPINKFDVLGISLQYELLFTNVLNVISVSKIPIFRKDRTESDPIVLCGGMVSSTPAPFAPFADLFCIGEGEEALVEFLKELKICKESGLSRSDTLRRLSELEGFYSPDYSTKPVHRQIYGGFAGDKGLSSYLIPNIEIVQNKLVVEIMRGCPNKCRFCQAGIEYKPCREKNISTIIDSIDYGIKQLGVKEVTLSSLSSGDYSRIEDLAEIFINRYSKDNISFSLPSLKVETFNKDLLSKMSLIRKSGLTFAIEAGSAKGQLSINKIIELDKIYAITDYAVQNGWRLMKFYFMIGLPFIENETADIIGFLDDIRSRYPRLDIHANVATFIPKAHTPYQNCRMMTIEESKANFEILQNHFRKTRVCIKTHDPETSFIEGIIARGDENVGMAMYEIFQNGIRFDGWKDHFDINNYTAVFEKYGITHERYLTGKNNFWSMIDVGVSQDYFQKEADKAQNFQTTDSCKLACDPACDICSAQAHSCEADKTEDLSKYKQEFVAPKRITNIEKRYFFVIQYIKTGLRKFVGHIDLTTYFKCLFDRAGIDIIYTQGFNPHQRLQFSQALSLGVESECELIEFGTLTDYAPEHLLEILQKYQHEDIKLLKIKKLPKSPSITTAIAYCDYRVEFDDFDTNNIQRIIDKIFNEDLAYSLPKKDKTVTGLYKDIIDKIDIQPNHLIATEIVAEGKPKFNLALEALFGTALSKIVKIKMYTKDRRDVFDALGG